MSKTSEKWVVIGQVQGVGFRYVVSKQAPLFQISGWVRNKTSGEVEICVAGENDLVQKFWQWLRNESGFTIEDIIRSDCPDVSSQEFIIKS